MVIAVDGRGGAGKTTYAAMLAKKFHAVVIHMDDYWIGPSDSTVKCGAGLATESSAPSDGAPIAPMSRYYDWEAVRAAVTHVDVAGASLPLNVRHTVIIEGVSSACPALADLVGASAVVQVPDAVRLERLHARVPDDEWDEEWLAEEERYFASLPPDHFTEVVSGLE